MKTMREIHFYEIETGTRIVFHTCLEHAKEIVDWMLDQTVKANKEAKSEQETKE